MTARLLRRALIKPLVPPPVRPSPHQSRTMKIQAIPMWPTASANYAYLLTDTATSQSAIIDPAEPAAVLAVLKPLTDSKSITLAAIVNTHHHGDHAGGNRQILAAYPGLPVIGGRDCDAVTQTPAHGSSVSIGELKVRALHTPCHTQDSICFFAEDGGERAVFTGDTLFTGGCGRFFEGTAAEMHEALNKRLAALPADTRVWPGHEYTKANVAFGISVERTGAMERLQEFARENGRTEGRFTIGDEKGHNVFMRVGEKVVREKVGKEDPVEVMAGLREMKNNFS